MDLKAVLSLESIVRNREYLSQKLKPFTNSEAINCTNFMRGVFEKELEKRNFDNKSEAFDDFLKSVQAYENLNKSFSDRLKEIMLSDKPSPWTGKTRRISSSAISLPKYASTTERLPLTSLFAQEPSMLTRKPQK